MKNLFILSLLALVSLGMTADLKADIAGEHPGYIHALSDLRLARAYLYRENPGPRDSFVVEEIDRAIHEIKHAAIDDGKNLDDHPPIDASLDFHGRFHQALELINRAHNDVAKQEDNVFAQGLQARAIEHIDKAHHVLRQIIDRW